MANTILNQPTAVSLQLTDYALLWQGGQSPSTRKMAISNLATYYLALTGGTVTGDVTFSAAKPKIIGNAGTVRAIQFLTSSTVRWQIDANATAESGTNAGSDFELWSYTDAGAQLTKALSIKRSSGAVTIIGTNTNDSASSGQVGQIISDVVPLASAVALTSGSVFNITGISLTAGDWDVRGEVWFTSTQGIAGGAVGMTTVSGTFAADPAIGFSRTQLGSGQIGIAALPTGPTRISVAVTTTVYLIAFASFGTGTASAYGKIEARRMR